MPHMAMAHDVDPAEEIMAKIGDLSGLEITRNQVLCAVYMRPKRTKSGLYLTDSTMDEDKYQSKVGLIIAKGPQAFIETETKWFDGKEYEIGEWCLFRPSDGWNLTIGEPPNGVLCRIMDDVSIRGRVSHPDLVY